MVRFQKLVVFDLPSVSCLAGMPPDYVVIGIGRVYLVAGGAKVFKKTAVFPSIERRERDCVEDISADYKS